MFRPRLALASAVAIACLITSGVVAQADPDKVEKARQELAAIQQEASAIDQRIIIASDEVLKAEAELEELTGDVAAQEAKVDDLVGKLGDVATMQLQNDSLAITAQLLSSDSSNFLSGLGLLQTEMDRSNAAVQQLQVDQARLTTLKEDAAALEKKLVADRDATVALAAEYDEKEAEAQKVYDRLSEEERERLAAIEAERIRRAEEAQRQAEALAAEQSAAATSSTSGAATAETAAPAVETGGSDRASRAVDIALAQVGKNYVWGTSGPNTFDCSGLTSYAYRQVGINISRSAEEQFRSAGRRVSKAELRPGDLVFYYSPVSHVGLYIGGGKIVDAANPRRGVRTIGLDSMPFAGAVRVIG